MNPVQQKFADFRASAVGGLIERDSEVDMVLSAFVAGQNCLLVGPPGVAKSMLAELIAGWIGGRFFGVQLNRYTSPEELFGPMDVSKMKAGEYARVFDGMLPDSDVCVLDEIFKASSTILNTLLRALNERKIRNGRVDVDIPLQLAIAASNEFPNDQEGGKELGALFDRFLFRKTVSPVRTRGGMERLLWNDIVFKPVDPLSVSELVTAKQEAAALAIPEETREAFRQIVEQCRTEGVVIGDRRLRQSVGACRAVAWLDGETEVKPDSLRALANTLWSDPDSAKTVASIVGKIANPSEMAINSILVEVSEILAEVDVADLAKVSVACKKLALCSGKLAKIPGAASVNAKTYVDSEAKALRARAMEAGLQ